MLDVKTVKGATEIGAFYAIVLLAAVGLLTTTSTLTMGRVLPVAGFVALAVVAVTTLIQNFRLFMREEIVEQVD